jgi:hypothetical protein
MIFVVVCNRSAEFKVKSIFRNSSRNVNKPQVDDAFSSRIKSGIPMKSIEKKYGCNEYIFNYQV